MAGGRSTWRSKRSEAADRVAFLAEATEVLTSAPEPGQLAERIARLGVPRAADYCLIEEHGPDGRRRLLAAAHVNPAMEAVLIEATAHYARVSDTKEHPSTAAFREKGYVRVDMTEEVLARHLEGRPKSAQEAVLRLNPRSYLVLPLLARGRLLGVLMLGMSESGRRFTDDDVPFVRQVATRVAVAVEQARLHRELDASEARFRAVFETSPVGIMLTSLRDGRVVAMNPQCEAQTGHRRDEAIGRTVAELGLYASLDDRPRITARLAAGETVRDLEVAGRTKAGERRTFAVSCTLTQFADEECVLGMTTDVTDRRRLEEQLWQSRKLEALGRLAGGVAHDFNNALTTIMGYLEMLLERLEPGPTRRHAEQSYRAARRASAHSRQLLAFSRRQVLSPRLVDLNTVLDDVELLRQLIGEHAELVIERAPAPLNVLADPAQLEQVVVNLALNARDAMPAGGQVTIHARADDAWALLSVSDTGLGMDGAQKARLFEPFFTTKPTGTGLGLASVYGIVTQSGGSVSVESEPGRGSTFVVRLPRVIPAATAEPPPAVAAEGSLTGSGTVLVVEDDDDLRALVVLILRGLGYEVLDASDGRVALQVAAAHGGEIALLLTDVIMPGMSGLDVAQQLTAARPGLRVLFMSGYTGEATTALAAHGTEPRFLAKPFSIEELGARVRDALASKVAARSR